MVNYSFSLIAFEYFILIFIRIASFVSVAPFFGMANTPARIKAGLSVFIALILYSVLPKTGLESTTIFSFATLVLKEIMTGLIIGFAAGICSNIMMVAGHIIDINVGLSMATEFDPITQSETAITGNLYNYLVLLLLLITNMHHYILKALVESYQLIPINGQHFHWNALLAAMVMYVTQLFSIAFQIILPIFACLMILDCVLGIMAKVAPQMNMFSVGMQLKILLGFFMMFLTVGLLPYISDFVFTAMKKIMVAMIKGMY